MLPMTMPTSCGGVAGPDPLAPVMRRASSGTLPTAQRPNTPPIKSPAAPPRQIVM